MFILLNMFLLNLYIKNFEMFLQYLVVMFYNKLKKKKRLLKPTKRLNINFK